jgi:hypothetical protein
VQAIRIQLEQENFGRKVFESMGYILLVWSSEYLDGYCDFDFADANCLAVAGLKESEDWVVDYFPYRECVSVLPNTYWERMPLT